MRHFDIVKIVTCQIAGKSKHACQPKAKRRDDSSMRFNESCGGHTRGDSDSAFARPPQTQLYITRTSLYNRVDPGKTRTCNLWFQHQRLIHQATGPMKYHQLLMRDLYKKLCENVEEFCLPLSLSLSLSLCPLFPFPLPPMSSVEGLP